VWAADWPMNGDNIFEPPTCYLAKMLKLDGSDQMQILSMQFKIDNVNWKHGINSWTSSEMSKN